MTPYYQDDWVTIYHGDSRELAPTLTADVLISDPPYGVANDNDYTRFTGGQRVNAALRQGRVWEPIRGDNQPFDPTPFLGFKRVVLWGANNYAHKLPPGAWFVWLKKRPALMGAFMSDAEVAWYSEGHGVFVYSHEWDGFNRASERGSHLHPTQKPVALFRWCIERAGASETILDPFMGSGTTLRAAKDLGRKVIGIEIEERYCEIAAKRMCQEVLAV